jgi:hypothetical protein
LLTSGIKVSEIIDPKNKRKRGNLDKLIAILSLASEHKHRYHL